MRNKKFIFAILTSSFLFSFVFVPIVFAESATDPITDTKITNITAVINLIDTIAGWFQIIVLAIAVIIIIWAGLVWMTAGGDEEKITTARRMILYGLVGVGIVIVAYGMVALVKSLLI